jgi:hypothetical protein
MLNIGQTAKKKISWALFQATFTTIFQEFGFESIYDNGVKPTWKHQHFSLIITQYKYVGKYY